MKVFIIITTLLTSLNLFACIDFSGKYSVLDLPDELNLYKIIQTSCDEIVFEYDQTDSKIYITDGKTRVLRQTPLEDRGIQIGTATEFYAAQLTESAFVVTTLIQYDYFSGKQESIKTTTQYSKLPNNDLLVITNNNGEIDFSVNRYYGGQQ